MNNLNLVLVYDQRGVSGEGKCCICRNVMPLGKKMILCKDGNDLRPICPDEIPKATSIKIGDRVLKRLKRKSKRFEILKKLLEEQWITLIGKLIPKSYMDLEMFFLGEVQTRKGFKERSRPLLDENKTNTELIILVLIEAGVVTTKRVKRELLSLKDWKTVSHRFMRIDRFRKIVEESLTLDKLKKEEIIISK